MSSTSKTPINSSALKQALTLKTSTISMEASDSDSANLSASVPCSTLAPMGLSYFFSNPIMATLLKKCLVGVGSNTELSISLLEKNFSPKFGLAVDSYWSQAHLFSRRRRFGHISNHFGDSKEGTPVIVVETLLKTYTQSTASPKQDLTDQYSALQEISSDHKLQINNALVIPSSENKDFVGSSLVELHIYGGPISNYLGGSFGPMEIKRTLAAEIQFAPWRDRRLRRFSKLKILATEVWPKPSDANIAATTLALLDFSPNLLAEVNSNTGLF